MRYGLISGCLWGLDTVILSIALSFGAFVATPEAIAGGALISSAFHDTFCAVWMFLYMAVRGRLKDTARALKTKNARVVVLAALLGGPVGMCAYVLAIQNVGAGITAIISSFYPAFGALLAAVFLGERLGAKRIVALFVAIAAIVVMGVFSAGAGDTAENATFGLVAACVCVLGWGSEAVLLSKGMSDDTIDNECALQIRETTSAIVFLCLVLPLSQNFLCAFTFLPTLNAGVIALAAAAGVASYLNYYKAIHKTGATKAMATNISYSAWAVIFGLILLGHIPSLLEIVCCATIFVATVYVARSDS